MPLDIDRLTPERALQPSSIDPNGKAAKQKLLDRHLIDYSVEPFDEEQFYVRCFAMNFDRGAGYDSCIGYGCCQGLPGLLERLRYGRAPAAEADIGIADPTAMDVHVRVERWALDEVPLPGPLVSDIVQLLYRENRFCGGTLTIRDRSLGPSSVRVPLLAIVALWNR